MTTRQIIHLSINVIWFLAIVWWYFRLKAMLKAMQKHNREMEELIKEKRRKLSE